MLQCASFAPEMADGRSFDAEHRERGGRFDSCNSHYDFHLGQGSLLIAPHVSGEPAGNGSQSLE